MEIVDLLLEDCPTANESPKPIGGHLDGCRIGFDAVDLEGATVIPGLVDIHSHGNSGHDFSDGDYEGLKKMAEYYLSCGVTSFAPASMTLPYETLFYICKKATNRGCLSGILPPFCTPFFLLHDRT